MTTAVLEKTLTLEEVSALHSNDVASMRGEYVTVAESGEHLNEYYKVHSRPVSVGGPYEYGKFWDKVSQVAEILKCCDEWPFPPLVVREKTLYDGHHRANAAIKVGWDKPIPVTTEWWDWW
ncbi:ParB-like nuclease domain protein [Mycobacterium phage GreedyLawyer]|uniref:ParB-like nuclease domain protein n=3 Tax=Caudoviricetes TaxID=2731619 RepID=A0A6G8R0S9_9CAUD|nr:ParB-like nuclease domain protein [Mycobacterium phage SuperAwesome]AVR76942.1 ParB-like nuclease domain protein [Mycobacterium phage GreedyLawyer]QIN93810.1 ParB-like nuclease domain protein [Mycobacterium phage Pmask]QXN73181.1 ParB-like nuclease domain protein [Mycobacterium Phage Cookiedough]QYW01289.1 ParB-like nuclease domain protein [Mycobacterium phage Hoot]UAJ16416.1 ParB-like nuclease domain protein [Mycobacterium phage Newrala]